MRKILLAFAAAAAMLFVCILADSSSQATPIMTAGQSHSAVNLIGVIDQVRLVCRRETRCGPMGRCRSFRVCEDVYGPGSGAGTGIPGSGMGPSSGYGCTRCGPAGRCWSVC